MAVGTPAKADSTEAPDIVVLKGGGFARGTIAEFDPNTKVVIRLVSGELRTYDVRETLYAGPEKDRSRNELERSLEGRTPQSGRAPLAAGSATDTPLAPTPVESPVEIRIEDDGRPLALYKERATSILAGSFGMSHRLGGALRTYDFLCTTPCRTHLPPGTYPLAVARDGRLPIPADPVSIAGPGVLHASYTSRTAWRVAGGALMLGSIVLGTYLMTTAYQTDSSCASPPCDRNYGLNMGPFVGGLAVVGLGTLGGTLLVFTVRDGAGLTLTPSATSSAPGMPSVTPNVPSTVLR
jgi:hypothetical protein